MATTKHFLIVPASGIGMRMKTNVPKQYLKLDNGLSVIEQTLKTLLDIEQISGCIVAISPHDDDFSGSKFAHHPKLLTTVIGGKQRFHSVINAIAALKPFAQNNDWVLVHDAVRPCVKVLEVVNLITQLKDHPVGGLLATRVVDTIKRANNNLVETTIERKNLWQAQTPQMYRFGVLSKALDKALANNLDVTDEASAVECLGLQSLLVNGSKNNIKITTQQDLALVNFYLKTDD